MQKVLERLGFAPEHGPEPELLVQALESLVGVTLHSEYRRFLTHFGGGYTETVWANCTVPTPFGSHNLTQLYGLADINCLLDSAITPRNMICIGFGNFGMTTCLSIAGVDHGAVFALDTEMRGLWDDETLRNLPDLTPEIKEFFRLRDCEQLPSRPWGYENCYHISPSFGHFLQELRRVDEL